MSTLQLELDNSRRIHGVASGIINTFISLPSTHHLPSKRSSINLGDLRESAFGIQMRTEKNEVEIQNVHAC
jgi:hypothetical protein